MTINESKYHPTPDAQWPGKMYPTLEQEDFVIVEDQAKVFHTFQVDNREVHLKRFPELSEKTQEIVGKYGFTPPRLEGQLKEYDSRVQEIQANMEEDRQTNLALLAAGVAMTAIPIVLLFNIAWSPTLVCMSHISFVFGTAFVCSSLYKMSRWGEKERVAIGQKQLQNFRQAAEEYLNRSSQYYKYQGKYLDDALDKEIAKGENLEDLWAAKEEIYLLCKQMTKVRGEPTFRKYQFG